MPNKITLKQMFEKLLALRARAYSYQSRKKRWADIESIYKAGARYGFKKRGEMILWAEQMRD